MTYNVNDAKIVFCLKNPLNIFLASFCGFIIYGELTENNRFSSKHTKIVSVYYEILIAETKKIIKYMVDAKNETVSSKSYLFKTETESCWWEINDISKKNVKICSVYETQQNDIVFDLASMDNFLKGLYSSIILSFSLTNSQNFFFFEISSLSKNSLLNLHDKNIELHTFIDKFLENQGDKKEYSFVYFNLFQYYYQDLLYLQRLKGLLR